MNDYFSAFERKLLIVITYCEEAETTLKALPREHPNKKVVKSAVERKQITIKGIWFPFLLEKDNLSLLESLEIINNNEVEFLRRSIRLE